MALSEKIQASLVTRKGTEAAKFPPKFETTPKRRDPVFLAGLAFGLVSGIAIISVGMRPAPAPVPVPAPVVAAPVEAKVSPEAGFGQAMEAEAAAALDRVNQGPTWSGAAFEENQRQAWDECKTDPAASGC
jgi:hypothetical protein